MNFLEAYNEYLSKKDSIGIMKKSWPNEAYYITIDSVIGDMFSSRQEIGDLVKELESDDWVVISK